MNKPVAWGLSALALGWLAAPLAQALSPAEPAVITDQSRWVRAVEEPAAPPANQRLPALPKAGLPNEVLSRASDEGCGANTNADAGCSEDHRPARRGRLIIGAGFYYLQPYWTDNPAYTVTVGFDLDGDPFFDPDRESTRQKDYDYDYDFVPVVWLGCVNCDGLGVRGRYWRYEHSADSEHLTLPDFDEFPPDIDFVNVNIPVGGGGENGPDAQALPIPTLSLEPRDTAAIANKLQLDVYDAEVIKQLEIGGCHIVLGAGARYAHIRQNLKATVLNTNDTTIVEPVEATFTEIFVDQLHLSNRFKGVGPTVSAEVRYPLPGGLAVYGGARGSVLFGTKVQRSNTAFFAARLDFDALAVSPLGLEFAADAEHSRDDVLPVGEAELGLEWGAEIGRALLALRAGWVGQIYHQLGSAAVPDSDLGMHGLVVSVEVRR